MSPNNRCRSMAVSRNNEECGGAKVDYAKKTVTDLCEYMDDAAQN